MNYDTLPNNVYYDANIVNNDKSGKSPPALVFSDIRSTAILTNPQLYELSVVRFHLETANSLPLWIPSIQLDQGANFDRNLTSYSFTLTYESGGMEYSSGQTYVVYMQSDFSADLPNRIETVEQLHIPYYFIKSFNTVVDMFNNGLSDAFDQLKNHANAFNVVLPTDNSPFFEWNSEASKFILNADVIGYDSREPGCINIFCNSSLYTLMSGFQGDYYGVNANGKNYQFKIKKEIRSLNLFTVNDNYSAIQLYQEYSSASLFTPISSIVFTSSMIPVLASNSGKPTIFNGQGNLRNSGENNHITSMITDFQSQDNNGYGFSSSLSYIPSSEYRCISMNNGSEKINNIDLNVYWMDKYSVLHSVYLYPGCSCTIKLLFRKIKNI